MTRKKPDDTAPNGKGGELREIDDEWRAKTNAQRKRLGISIRELARRAGCSHAILVAALDPAKGKTVFSWYDACEEALRRAERGDESRVHAPRPQGAARDVSEDALPVGSARAHHVARECRRVVRVHDGARSEAPPLRGDVRSGYPAC